MTTQTELKPCKSGDIGDERVLTLVGVDSLTDASSVVCFVSQTPPRRGGRIPVTATLDAAVTDAAENEVTIQLGLAPGDWLPDEPEVGIWWMQTEVSFTNGDVLTWPANGADRIAVHRAYA